MITFKLEHVGPNKIGNSFPSFDSLQRYIQMHKKEDASYHLWIDYKANSQQYFTFSRTEAINKTVKQVVLEDLDNIINSTSKDVSVAWKMEATDFLEYLDEIEYLEALGI